VAPFLRRATYPLLLAVAFAGIAHVALLPPFEGFDETAHWSYIQQLADTDRIPVYGQDRLSGDLATYDGPMAAGEGQPYAAWLATHRQVAGASNGPTRFSEGSDLNWQAQHPPLFYALMVLPYHALAGLPWRVHLLGLRLVAWAAAFAGFALSVLTTQRMLMRLGVTGWRLLLPPAWPFLFPEFFPEFGRLTNDALCLLLVACLWWMLQAWLAQGGSRARALWLGTVLGAGLLTKAFFLPVTVGVALLLGIVAWRRGGWRDSVLVPVVALAIGGFWYVATWRATGSVIGANDMIALQARGGMLAGLRAHADAARYAAGVARILGTFAWAGTWSFAHPPALLVAPVAALPIVALVGFLRRRPWRHMETLAPLLIVAPVIAGLLYHLLGRLAATGEGTGTPGWYLHIFVGPLSLVLAMGVPSARFAAPLLGYAALFSAGVAWLQLAFFSGCLPRIGMGLVRPMQAVCLLDLARLRQVAMPDVGLACATVALVLLGLAAWRAAQPGSG
jgi:hypothetical protein